MDVIHYILIADTYIYIYTYKLYVYILYIYTFIWYVCIYLYNHIVSNCSPWPKKTTPAISNVQALRRSSPQWIERRSAQLVHRSRHRKSPSPMAPDRAGPGCAGLGWDMMLFFVSVYIYTQYIYVYIYMIYIYIYICRQIIVIVIIIVPTIQSFFLVSFFC